MNIEEALALLLVHIAALVYLKKRPALAVFTLFSLFAHLLPTLAATFMDAPVYTGLGPVRAPFVHAALTVALTASAGTAVGYGVYIAWSTLRPSRFRPTSHVSSPLDVNYELASTVVLLATGIAITAQPLGPYGFVVANLQRVPIETGMASLIYAAIVLYSFLVTCLLVQRIRFRQSLPYVHLLCSLSLFWILGGRVQFAITLISYSLLLLRYGLVAYGVLIIVGALTAFLLNLILYLRLSIQGAEPESIAAMAFTTFDQLSMLDTYNITAQYVDRTGHDIALYWKMLIQLVPRGIWEDKPLQISRLFRMMFFYDNLGGIPPGLYGEFHIIGGYLFCAVGGSLFGATLASIDEHYRRLHSCTIPSAALCVILAPILGLYVPRGGFDNTVFRIAIILASWSIARALPTVLPSRRSNSRASPSAAPPAVA